MLTVEPATAADAATILGLRHAAEDWLFARGIDQWTPREVPLATVDAQIEAGEFYVARREPGGPIVGALRLIWADPDIWPGDGQLAGYVHGLVIDRSEAGTGLGTQLLEWAAGRTRREGRSLLRLDCAETNAELRGYYLRQRFREVGRREFADGSSWFSVALFEKSTDR
ncbi:GNAT family N-acetyltransferase [Rhodococcus sp. IEGM 1330]|uniref:GNAT family N-acetyltransferase n=1 Tax=Rhodococcus sp. IEGM 1330 TaxID=3082225 RepID=UPI0029559FBB|nr:GNAT family N-acetyltransferase [Rhodococcus sp. IEGM 1330]MDV8021072.1 GNAT family N-acetyltransferase [Rhodococcus sp. IEGM 1330]